MIHCSRNADQPYIALAGLAGQAADRLPHMIPHPSSHPLTEADSASWQAHSFQTPLQIWHQLKTCAGSYLPKPLHEAATGLWSSGASDDRGNAVWRGVHQMGKQVLSWPSLQQLGGKVAGRLPGLVPMEWQPSAAEEERSQVSASWHYFSFFVILWAVVWPVCL